MPTKREMEDLIDIKGEINYLKDGIEVIEAWADQAHIDEAYELEAPCRATVHHMKTILDLFLASRNMVVEELAAERSPTKDRNEEGPILTIVK